MLVRQVLGGAQGTGLLVPISVGNNGQFFFEVYDFVANAETLEQLINETHPFDVRSSLKVIAKLARALHVLHSNSIVHADVKPTNVLVRRDRSLNEIEIFLTDFGMARPVAAEDTVLVVGTYAYMHPSLRGKFEKETTQYCYSNRRTDFTSRSLHRHLCTRYSRSAAVDRRAHRIEYHNGS